MLIMTTPAHPVVSKVNVCLWWLEHFGQTSYSTQYFFISLEYIKHVIGSCKNFLAIVSRVAVVLIALI